MQAGSKGATPGLPRTWLGLAAVAAMVVACTSANQDPSVNPEGLSEEQVEASLDRRLDEFRVEMGQRYATFEKGAQLSNKMASLDAEVRDLRARLQTGDIPRVDGLAASFFALEQAFGQLERELENERAPLRDRVSLVEGRIDGGDERRSELEEELNAAYQEIHDLREEMLGVLGSFEAYRGAFTEILELRRRVMEEERDILDRASGSDG